MKNSSRIASAFFPKPNPFGNMSASRPSWPTLTPSQQSMPYSLYDTVRDSHSREQRSTSPPVDNSVVQSIETDTNETTAPAPSIESTRKFLDDVAALKDWTHPTMKQKFRDLIRWHDQDNLRGVPLAQMYTAAGYTKDGKNGRVVKGQYIHRVYNEHAARFYQHHDITWIPLMDRIISSVDPRQPKVSAKGLAAPKPAHRRPIVRAEVEDFQDNADTRVIGDTPHTNTKLPNGDRLIHTGKGMNTTKASAAVVEKQMAQVQAKLAEYKACGYKDCDVDRENKYVKHSGGNSTTANWFEDDSESEQIDNGSDSKWKKAGSQGGTSSKRLKVA